MKYLRALKFCSFAILATLMVSLVNESKVLSLSFEDIEQPQSVVRVECNHPMMTEKGSGVLIRSDLILTAHHVIRDGLTSGILKEDATVNVIFKNGLTRSANVIRFSKKWDLALLQFESVLIMPARPADSAAVRDQEVTVCGFPNGGDYQERAGRVVGFRSPDQTSKPGIFVVSNKCESGMSGGPVFDFNGDVVGILFGTLQFANCTGLEAINEFINESIPREGEPEATAKVTGNSVGGGTPKTELPRQSSNHTTD
ncbi:MAG: serine protease [Nitrososphaera sp.]|nr:serine protease [Nitrososphaera sp.]